MSTLNHAFAATFEELLQLAYALTEPGELILTPAGRVRRKERRGTTAQECPLCAAFNNADLRSETGVSAQYPAGQLRRFAEFDEAGPRFYGLVFLESGAVIAPGWERFINAADNVSKAEFPHDIDLMREVLVR